MTDDSEPRVLHTGEGKVLVPFTVDELVPLIAATDDECVRDRMLTAVELLDADSAAQLRKMLVGP